MTKLAQLIENIIPTPTKSASNIYRQKRRYTSKLDPYRVEICILYNELNQSASLIQRWLFKEKNIHISVGAIHHRLKHWHNISESTYEER